MRLSRKEQVQRKALRQEHVLCFRAQQEGHCKVERSRGGIIGNETMWGNERWSQLTNLKDNSAHVFTTSSLPLVERFKILFPELKSCRVYKRAKGWGNTWSFLLCSPCLLACSFMSDSLWPRGLSPARLLCPWNLPSKNTGAATISYSRESSRPRDQT